MPLILLTFNCLFYSFLLTRESKFCMFISVVSYTASSIVFFLQLAEQTTFLIVCERIKRRTNHP